MTRYQKLKETIDTDGRPVYSPYIMLGYPNVERCLDVCKTLIAENVDGFELGMPFRDPVADGPIVEAAGNVALDNGMTTEKAVNLVRQIRDAGPNVPLTLMSYYNMVMAKTPDRFIGEFANAGLDGLLIPDLPPERAKEVVPLARKHNIDLVFIVSPLSNKKRLEMISEHIGGFAYVLTRLGVTGINSRYSDTLEDLFARIHKHIALPAIAGFGVSEAEHAVKMVAAGADGVITGSRLVQLIQDCTANGGWNPEPVIEHTRGMLTALRNVKVTALAK